MGTVVDDAAAAEFHEFFEAHYAELARLAHLLTGEADAADDLAADALLALWHRWDRVRNADHPVAYDKNPRTRQPFLRRRRPESGTLPPLPFSWLRNGASGLRVRHDFPLLLLMIRGVVSPGPEASTDR